MHYSILVSDEGLALHHITCSERETRVRFWKSFNLPSLAVRVDQINKAVEEHEARHISGDLS